MKSITELRQTPNVELTKQMQDAAVLKEVADSLKAEVDSLHHNPIFRLRAFELKQELQSLAKMDAEVQAARYSELIPELAGMKENDQKRGAEVEKKNAFITDFMKEAQSGTLEKSMASLAEKYGDVQLEFPDRAQLFSEVAREYKKLSPEQKEKFAEIIVEASRDYLGNPTNTTLEEKIWQGIEQPKAKSAESPFMPKKVGELASGGKNYSFYSFYDIADIGIRNKREFLEKNGLTELGTYRSGMESNKYDHSKTYVFAVDEKARKVVGMVNVHNLIAFPEAEESLDHKANGAFPAGIFRQLKEEPKFNLLAEVSVGESHEGAGIGSAMIRLAVLRSPGSAFFSHIAGETRANPLRLTTHGLSASGQPTIVGTVRAGIVHSFFVDKPMVSESLKSRGITPPAPNYDAKSGLEACKWMKDFDAISREWVEFLKAPIMKKRGVVPEQIEGGEIVKRIKEKGIPAFIGSLMQEVGTNRELKDFVISKENYEEANSMPILWKRFPQKVMLKAIEDAQKAMGFGVLKGEDDSKKIRFSPIAFYLNSKYEFRFSDIEELHLLQFEQVLEAEKPAIWASILGQEARQEYLAKKREAEGRQTEAEA